MSALHIRLAEWTRERGEEREHGYNARLITPPSDVPEAEKGSLLILLELTGPLRQRRRFLRHLLNTVQSTYYATPGPIKSALVYAVRTAHQELLTINESAEKPEDRYLCNATCLVLKDDEINLVQVGAMTAAVLLPTGLQWFSPLQNEEEDPIPLGLERDVRPYTVRMNVVPGTAILLLDSGWLGQMDVEVFRHAIALSDPEEMLRVLARAVSAPNLSALALKLTSAGEEIAAPEWPVIEETEEEEGEDAGPASRAPGREAEPVGRRLLAGAQTLTRRLLPAGSSEGEKEALEELTMPPPPPITRPSPWPFRKKERSQRRVLSGRWRRWLWAIAVLIPLLALLTTGFLWWQQARQQEMAYKNALREAATAIQQAGQASDRAGARQYLRQADVALRQAEHIHPGAPQIAQLRTQLQDQQLTVERVKPLYVMWPLATFSGGEWSRVVARRQDVFTLNRGDDVVMRYTLDEKGQAVAEGGQQRLFGRGDALGDATVGDLVDITWLPAGPVTQLSALLALDGTGKLFTYDSTRGGRRLALARPDGWQSPKRIVVYGDRLYVLDPGANVLFRFSPGNGGYTAPPDNYFQTPVQLDGVEDVAIDGAVYLLFPDGRILRYFQGKQVPFVADTTLSTPTAIFTNERIHHIYVADAGNKRIVVLGKEQDQAGKFVAQLVPGEGFNVDFGDIRSIFITDDEAYIYILTGHGLWRAPLPISSPVSPPSGAGGGQ